MHLVPGCFFLKKRARRTGNLQGTLHVITGALAWHELVGTNLWQRHFNKSILIDIFENPYGAPRPTESENLPATKQENPKNSKTPIISKSKRSFPKSKRSFPKSKRSFPKSKR